MLVIRKILRMYLIDGSLSNFLSQSLLKKIFKVPEMLLIFMS